MKYTLTEFIYKIVANNKAFMGATDFNKNKMKDYIYSYRKSNLNGINAYKKEQLQMLKSAPATMLLLSSVQKSVEKSIKSQLNLCLSWYNCSNLDKMS